MIWKKPVIPPVVLRAFMSGLGNYIDPSRPLWSLMQKQYVALQWSSLNLDETCNLSPEQAPTTLQGLYSETGWRFAASDGDLYGACHVGSIHRENNTPPILTGFSYDVQTLTFMESLEQLKALPLPDEMEGDGPFELRGLSIRWLHFEAFWLRELVDPPKPSPADPYEWAGDIVVPYAGFVEDFPNYLELMYPYPVKDFLTAIWPCVQTACERKKQTAKDAANAPKTSAQKAQDAAKNQRERLAGLAEKADDAAKSKK
jgi:hypothetical protein